MSSAKVGDKVKVHYTGKLEDGQVFDSSQGRDPFEFTLGEGKVIPGFEKGITGMEVGQEKTLTIPPTEAYGEHREALVADVNKSEFPEHITPEVGQSLQLRQEDGSPITARITEIDNEKVTLDANHPLAGKTLVFDVKLIEIA